MTGINTFMLQLRHHLCDMIDCFESSHVEIRTSVWSLAVRTTTLSAAHTASFHVKSPRSKGQQPAGRKAGGREANPGVQRTQNENKLTKYSYTDEPGLATLGKLTAKTRGAKGRGETSLRTVGRTIAFLAHLAPPRVGEGRGVVSDEGELELSDEDGAVPG